MKIMDGDGNIYTSLKEATKAKGYELPKDIMIIDVYNRLLLYDDKNEEKAKTFWEYCKSLN